MPKEANGFSAPPPPGLRDIGRREIVSRSMVTVSRFLRHHHFVTKSKERIFKPGSVKIEIVPSMPQFQLTSHEIESVGRN